MPNCLSTCAIYKNRAFLAFNKDDFCYDIRMPEEWFEIVDQEGKVVGRALRQECHRNPALMHRVAHVLIFDRAGRLFLQKRSRSKDIQPGKWDTSVGGHLGPGETPEQAAQRELLEEVGIPSVKLHFLYEYIMRSPVETEWVSTFQIVWDGPIQLQPEEIEEGRFWDLAEIRKTLGSGLFTPNFEDEFQRWSSHREPGVNE